MLESYLDHCFTALMTYGKYVFTTLKTERYFYDYVGDEKSQDHCKFFYHLKLCGVQKSSQLLNPIFRCLTNFAGGPNR